MEGRQSGAERMLLKQLEWVLRSVLVHAEVEHSLAPHINRVRRRDLHPSVDQQPAQLVRHTSRRDQLERRQQLILDEEGSSRLRSGLSGLRQRIVAVRIETNAAHLHTLPLLESTRIGGKGQQLLDAPLLDIVDGLADLQLDEVHVQGRFEWIGPPRLRSAARDSLACRASVGLFLHVVGVGRLDVPPE